MAMHQPTNETMSMPSVKESVWEVVAPLLAMVGMLSFLLYACDSPSPHSAAAEGRLLLSSTASFLPADGQSTTTINAFVLNRQGEPMTGADVIFSTNLGVLTGTNPAPISSGEAQITLQSVTRSGTAEVVARVKTFDENGYPDELKNEIYIPISSPKYAVDLRSVGGNNTIAAGSNFELRAFVTDSVTGAPVPAGIEVNFALCGLSPTPNPDLNETLGFLTDTLAVTDGEGVATVSYVGPSNIIGAQARFVAWAGELVPMSPEMCPAADPVNFPGYDEFFAFTTSNTATPTPTPSPTPTSTPTPTSSPTPGDTPTSAPTATPTSSIIFPNPGLPTRR